MKFRWKGDVAPDTGISNKTMAILNSFVNDIFERICKLKRISAEAGTSWYQYLQQGDGDLELLYQ